MTPHLCRTWNHITLRSRALKLSAVMNLRLSENSLGRLEYESPQTIVVTVRLRGLLNDSNPGGSGQGWGDGGSDAPLLLDEWIIMNNQ